MQGLLGRTDFRQAGPTGALERVKVLSFTAPDGPPFMLYAVESAVPQIAQWCVT